MLATCKLELVGKIQLEGQLWANWLANRLHRGLGNLQYLRASQDKGYAPLEKKVQIWALIFKLFLQQSQSSTCWLHGIQAEGFFCHPR